jgi:hypothetical protein
MRERLEDARRRQVLLRRCLARERQALEVATNIAQRAGGVELLLHGVEAHVEAQRDGLGLLRAAVDAREDVGRDAEIRTAEQRGVAQGGGQPRHARAAACAGVRVAVAVVLERDELGLRREPAREGLAPREDAREALEPERAAVQDAHVVVVHGPLARACALGPFGEVVRRGDGQVLEVHEELHHLRHDVCVPGLGLSVHRPRERQALDAAGQIGAREHGPAEVEKPLLGDGDVFVELGFYVHLERTGYEAEAVVEVGGAYELQYGPEKLGW